MALSGDIISLFISLAQEVGIVAGVSALTITLTGHLLSLQARQEESLLGYVRVARHVRAAALAIIVDSGIVDALVRLSMGTLAELLAPAHVFMWLLVGLVTALYFLELDVSGFGRDAVEGFEGANWYALFIVHAAAPAIGWVLLLQIYGGWLAFFAIVWTGFVWFMRHKALPQKAPAPPPAAPARPPAPAPAVTPTPAPQPTPASVVVPAPTAPGPQTAMPKLDEATPALEVMPKRPEDIARSSRGPIVKMGEEQA